MFYIVKRIVVVLSLFVLASCGQENSSTAQNAGSSTNTEPAQATTMSPAGEEIYERACFSCHAAGLSGAPKLGDVEAWAPRIAKGDALLLKTTIDGVGAMPPRGVCLDCSDEDLAAAIDYMVSESQ